MKYFFSFLIFLLPLAIIAQCEHPDFAGLMELYDATNGDAWGENAGWLEAKNGTACDPCDYNGGSWAFLSCQNGRVKNIYFSFNNLQGTIPDFALSELEEFTIVDNLGVTGLPEFTNTPKLKKIAINRCDIGGPIPNFSQSPQIELIELTGNDYTGPLPVFDLPNLKSLVINDNDLSGGIPDFDKLPQLTTLNLRGNALTGPIPNFNIPNLVELNLSSNQLSGVLPTLEYLSELNYFDCSNNLLEGSVHTFEFNPVMGNINLINNRFTGNVPDFKDHPNLTSLIFFAATNDMSGCYPESVCDLLGKSFIQNPKLPFRGAATSYCDDPTSDYLPCSPDGTFSVGLMDEDCNCIEACDYYKADYDELMKFYESANGEEWDIATGWQQGANGTSCSPCDYNYRTWYGVFCFKGKVIGLDLDGTPNFTNIGVGGINMTGTIPALSIETLTALFFDDNKLTGTLPDMSGLPNLEHFIVSQNNLSGALPDFQALKNLKVFRGSFNGFEGNIPNLNGLDSLQTFTCFGNELQGCLDTVLCDINLVDLRENEMLPWSGDIEPFCEGEDQVGAPCNLTMDEDYAINENCECVLFISQVDDHNLETTTIYPNPSSDFIKVNTNLKDTTFTIFDSSSKEMFREKNDVIDISHLPKGIYFIRVNFSKQIFKFVKV